MITWIKIIHLGDPTVLIPAATAIAAWLVAGRAWRMALWWCLLFTVGVALVVASKITFIGWGSGIPSLDFKALSGHAMLTTAVIPVMFFLLLQWATPVVRTAGVLLGIVFSVLMCILLVMGNYHSISETVAGFIIGAIVSFSFIWRSDNLSTVRLNRWLIPFGALAFLAGWFIHPSSIEHWMTSIALYFSGHVEPYSWTTRTIFK